MVFDRNLIKIRPGTEQTNQITNVIVPNSDKNPIYTMLSLTHFGTNDVTSRTSAPSVSNDMFCVGFQK